MALLSRRGQVSASSSSVNSTHANRPLLTGTPALAVATVKRRIISAVTAVTANPTASIQASFSPSSFVASQWDRYTVDKVIIRAFKSTGSYPAVFAYDPSSVTAVSTNAQVLSYSDSIIVEPTFSTGSVDHPVFLSYTVNKPTHQANDGVGDLRTAINTSQAWVAGSFHIGSFFTGATSAGWIYALEWHITLMGPRGEL